MATEEIRIIGRANMDEVNEALDLAGLKLNQFNKHLNDNFIAFKKNGKAVNVLEQRFGDLGRVMSDATIKSRRFKFEWLSIMFAGMALDRAFGGLIRTQMELFGVTDALGSAWTVVLLPIMELITPLIFKLIEAFMEMPEGMKLAIGAIVLFGAIMGKIMLVAGQLMLFLGGLKILLGGKGIGAAVLALKGFVVGLGATFAIVAAVITAVVIGIWLAWRTNFLNIRQNFQGFVEGIKKWFGGIISIIKGVLNIVKGIFMGDFELIKKGIIQVFKGLWDFIIGGFKAAGNAVLIIFKGVVKLVWNLFKVLIDSILFLPNKIGKVFGVRDIRMPSFQTGGLVSKTGPAFLHSGERVIPKGRANQEVLFSPTVNINATINSEMDVKVLADKLNRQWASEFERIIQGRGSI